MWVIALLILIVFEAIADIFSKQYSLAPSWWFWALALIAYCVGNVFWLVSIRNGSGLARGAVLFSIGSAITAIVIGAIFYREKIGTVEMAGLLVGVLAIILIFWTELSALFKG